MMFSYIPGPHPHTCPRCRHQATEQCTCYSGKTAQMHPGQGPMVYPDVALGGADSLGSQPYSAGHPPFGFGVFLQLSFTKDNCGSIVLHHQERKESQKGSNHAT